MHGSSDVFICYAGPDRTHATALATACREAGLSVFMDTDLTPGDLWDEEIPRALNQAAIVAVLVTPRWDLDEWPLPPGEQRSWYGPEEVASAIRRARRRGGVRVVPILFNADADAVPYGLERAVSLAVGADGWLGVAERLRAVRDGRKPAPHLTKARTAVELDLPVALIEALADHFSDVQTARSLWIRAGGRGRNVPNLNRPVDLWQRLWIASRQGAAARPEALLKVALVDLPNNATFRRYLEALQREALSPENF